MRLVGFARPDSSSYTGTSEKGELVNMSEFTAALPDTPIVFAVGAHSHGDESQPWTEQTISVSQYPLSASVALGRIMNAFEQKWNIL